MEVAVSPVSSVLPNKTKDNKQGFLAVALIVIALLVSILQNGVLIGMVVYL
jgi:hypothetical protein